MKVVIRADASRTIGSGHLVRCVTLALALRKRGAAVIFVSRPLEGHLSKVVLASGFDLKTLPESAEGDTEISDMDAAWRDIDGAVDWLVVDSYLLDARWESFFRCRAARLLVIDDLADRNHDCDALLDQGFAARIESYRLRVRRGTQLMLGTRYALLREEFSQVRTSAVRTAMPDDAVIHMFFGGYDEQSYTTRFSNWALEAQGDVRVRATVGAQYPDIAGLERLERSHPNRFVWRREVTDIAVEMSRCTLGVGSPGMATWERACLGLPALYVATSPNQIPILERLQSEGFCRFIGSANEVSKEKFVDALRQSLADRVAYASMREKGMAAVDGAGAARVAELMEKFAWLDTAKRICMQRDNTRLIPYDKDCDQQTVDWLNSRHVRKGFGFGGDATLDEHRAWIAANRHVVVFAVLDGSGLYCGNVLLHLDLVERSCYLQIYIGLVAALGKGIGRSAVWCALQWVFEIADFDRVWLHALVTNHAALKLYKKLGFAEEELERDVKLRDGSRCDQYRLSMARDSWKSSGSRS